MKTKIMDKKGKKRSLSESSVPVKPNQKQGNANEPNKNSKKMKFVSSEQNGNLMLEKVQISKMDKQKKKKITDQQNSTIKPLETKKDTKGKTELTTDKLERKTVGDKTGYSRRNRNSFKILDSKDLTVEEMIKKVEEIKSREVLSRRARRTLGILYKKLRLKGHEIEPRNLNKTGKKNNEKIEHQANALVKNKQQVNKDGNKRDKMETKKKPVQSAKDKLQEDLSDEEEDDSDSEVDDNDVEGGNNVEEDDTDEEEDESDEEEDDDDEDDEEDEDDEDENDESMTEMKINLDKIKQKIDDEDEDDEEDEEDEEDVEDEEDEEDEKDEEEDEDEDDEEDEEDEEESEEDEEEKKDANKKANIWEIKKKEIEHKNKQPAQPTNDQKKGETKKRPVLFVGNLPSDITGDEIKRHFLTKVNTITSIKIPTMPGKTESRGFAYVEMANHTDCEKGLSLNHTFLKKRKINVQYALPIGTKAHANKQFIVSKNKKFQAFQKAGKFAGGNRKQKPFQKQRK